MNTPRTAAPGLAPLAACVAAGDINKRAPRFLRVP